jgi:hypothetical protein
LKKSVNSLVRNTLRLSPFFVSFKDTNPPRSPRTISLFLRFNDKKVYYLNAATGDTGEWPMFKYNAEGTGAK